MTLHELLLIHILMGLISMPMVGLFWFFMNRHFKKEEEYFKSEEANEN